MALVMALGLLAGGAFGRFLKLPMPVSTGVLPVGTRPDGTAPRPAARRTGGPRPTPRDRAAGRVVGPADGRVGGQGAAVLRAEKSPGRTGETSQGGKR
ncbi:hypothetical protein GCM10010389_40120 [Streptomyces echinoruber]|uniref:Uncharacterized protein n=1 Tax=Streptomyces echinoruber TaxID=68898 RepID=A0A918RJ38_9ACTN|nr:hypothetical protein GCM10010389_40120 [Streptomyces echinoruber]